MKSFVLVISNDPQINETCGRILGNEGYTAELVTDSSRALALIHKVKPHLIITAVRMPENDGFSVLKAAHAVDKNIPVIAVTTHASIPESVRFLKNGGANYLAVPFQAGQFADAIAEAISDAGHIGPDKKAERLRPDSAYESIVGTSPPIRRLRKTILKVARTDVNVLILGETGTGKELVAQAIHERSPRARHVFLPVDCASLPHTLLESELFGHEKGAFTGAHRSRYGLFEAANRGTIFLDEIGELTVSTQSKLFRVIQEGKIRQIGGRTDTVIDVRTIAATNRDLEEGLRDGSFREELYFRLNVVSLKLPPLRRRQEDIPLLVDHFFDLFRISHGRSDLKGVDSSFMKVLIEYPWPGNIRQLMNVVERAVALSDGPMLTSNDIEEAIHIGARTEHAVELDLDLELPEYSSAKENVLLALDQQYFQRLLATCGGNLSEAARRSGLGRKTLYNKLRRIGVLPLRSSDSK